MQFVVTAFDATDDQAAERRAAARPAHLAGIAAAQEKGTVVCAGGMTNEEGKTIGSLLVLDFATRDLLDEYLANEAYIAANVWETVQVNGINVVIVNNQRVGA